MSLGEATLVISDGNDQALTHWSLAAVVRVNPGGRPAIFSPDGDPGETLELGPEEAEMVEAIETLRLAIDRARPKPGRLRALGIAASVLAVIGLAVLWLPDALRQQALSVVPDIRQHDIGLALLERIERVSGAACTMPGTGSALSALADRTGVRDLVVLPGGVRTAMALPGGIMAINRSLVEDYEDPAIVAGFILAERERARAADPMKELLVFGGPIASFRLLTTGEIAPDLLTEYAEDLAARPRPPLPDDALLAAFGDARIPSTLYAYARDITGETVLTLIEADPMAGHDTPEILNDRDWIRLQNICLGG